MSNLLNEINSGRRCWPYYVIYEYQGKEGEYIGGHTTEETDIKKVEQEIREIEEKKKNSKVVSLEVSPPRTCVFHENGIKIWWMPGERHYKQSCLRDQPPHLAVEMTNYYGEKSYDKLDKDFVEAIIKLYLDKKFPFPSETPLAVPPEISSKEIS